MCVCISPAPGVLFTSVSGSISSGMVFMGRRIRFGISREASVRACRFRQKSIYTVSFQIYEPAKNAHHCQIKESWEATYRPVLHCPLSGWGNLVAVSITRRNRHLAHPAPAADFFSNVFVSRGWCLTVSGTVFSSEKSFSRGMLFIGRRITFGAPANKDKDNMHLTFFF